MRDWFVDQQAQHVKPWRCPVSAYCRVGNGASCSRAPATPRAHAGRPAWNLRLHLKAAAPVTSALSARARRNIAGATATALAAQLVRRRMNDHSSSLLSHRSMTSVALSAGSFGLGAAAAAADDEDAADDDPPLPADGADGYGCCKNDASALAEAPLPPPTLPTTRRFTLTPPPPPLAAACCCIARTDDLAAAPEDEDDDDALLSPLVLSAAPPPPRCGCC
jgi:hypothetical protein